MKWIATKQTGIYKCNGAYRARVTIDGHRTWRDLKATTLLDASLERHDLIYGKKAEQNTFYDMFKNFIISRCYVTEEWNTKSESYLYNHLQSLHSKTTVTSDDIQSIINSKMKTLSPRTLKAIKDVVSAMYSYYIKRGMLDYNPAKYVDIPSFDNRRYFKLDKQKTKTLHHAIHNYPNLKYRAYFLLGLYGRRKGEISKMKYEHFDLATKTYIVPSENAKNRRPSVFPIPEALYLALKDDWKQSGLIFTTKNGEPLYWTRKRWNKLIKECGIEKMRFHDLRHLLGHIMVDEGYPLEHIQRALGHTNIKTTQRYAELSPEKVTDITNSYLDMFNEDV